MIKLAFLGSSILFASVLLSGCSSSTPATPSTSSTGQLEKVGDTVLTGTVFEQSGRYYLKNIVEKPQETMEIDSYSIDLQTYLGKQVTITGQYSGDTLFVAKIE